ncbi:MAG TPA: choice-of-anchor M domain-containing protein, partial [Phycisphaerae bacterium]|nr:choice-of-anchor M domain-containing protein [Phycisphaerae bacterium]
GVPAGQDIWVLPFAPAPDTLHLGVAAEEVKPGTLLSYIEADPRVAQEGAWIRLSLVDMRGPGEFSIWTTDAFGQPIVWMSTFDNPLDNALFVLESQHAHFNYGFTAEGIYEIDVVASALLPDGTLVTSDVATYTFGVKEVPEPASLLALCCMLPVLGRRR